MNNIKKNRNDYFEMTSKLYLSQREMTKEEWIYNFDLQSATRDDILAYFVITKQMTYQEADMYDNNFLIKNIKINLPDKSL